MCLNKQPRVDTVNKRSVTTCDCTFCCNILHTVISVSSGEQSFILKWKLIVTASFLVKLNWSQTKRSLDVKMPVHLFLCALQCSLPVKANVFPLFKPCKPNRVDVITGEYLSVFILCTFPSLTAGIMNSWACSPTGDWSLSDCDFIQQKESPEATALSLTLFQTKLGLDTAPETSEDQFYEEGCNTEVMYSTLNIITNDITIWIISCVDTQLYSVD